MTASRRLRGAGALFLSLCLVGLALPLRGEVAPAASHSASGLHTAIEAASPPGGATVRRPVTEVRLRFTTEVRVSLSSIALSGPDGPVAEGRSPEAVEGAGGTEIRLPLDGPLPTGRYVVEWRTAGPDSHPVRGSYTFRVGRAAAAPGADSTSGGGDASVDPAAGPGAPDDGSHAPTPAGIAVGWLFFLSIVGMVGPVAFRGVVLARLARDEELRVAVPRAARGAWRIAGAAAALAFLVLPARIWHQSVALFGGGALAPSNLWSLLFESPWGAGWLLETALALLFVLGVVWARPAGARSRGWIVMGLAAAGMCVVPGVSGHAWGAGALRTPAVTTDALHVLAAGVWMGGLGSLLLAGLPAVRAMGGRAAFPGLLPGLVAAFSRMAVAAVALLVASGAIGAWIHLSSPTQLFTTGYGRTLALKLAVVAGAMALGFYNWRVVRPSLEERPEPGLIRIPAAVELVLGLLALAVAAALVATSPPG